MVYFVVYRASKDHSNRSLIPNRLRALDCRQIQGTFWEYEREKSRQLFNILRGNEPVFLKRTKEIRRRVLAEGVIQDLGSMVVVALKAPRDKKENIRILVKNAPCIRLCRRVYAFYQRQTQLDPENRLIDARSVAVSIRELQGEARLIPKIVILNRRSIQRLVEGTRRNLEREILDIVSSCKQVYEKHSRDELDQKRIHDALRRLRRRFVSARRKARYFERWIALDFSRSLMSAYRALLKLRHACRKQMPLP